jgi:ribulose-phosphate 3-epimerase
MKNIIVSPSLLAADPMRFGEELASVEAAGADWHHVDVMDGHFVPNLTYGLPFVEALKKNSKIPLDVHIMITNPDQVAGDYVSAGADILVFHIEASTHPHRTIQKIKSSGAKAGIALNPGTPTSAVSQLIADADLFLVMTVNPGFGGQKFIHNAVDKISELKAMLAKAGRTGAVEIEVDGGVNHETVGKVRAAGATALVAGTYVYGAKDRAAAIASLRK